jgi:glycosyltransferase involved in cell wall biosynthesis
LDLFAESVALARAQGADIEVSVCGAGALGPLRARLEALGAHIVNHWLSDAEIAAALARADVVAATHTEASQSGIVAAAFGAGRPVLATPVGALPEQVAHERTGLVAARAEAGAVAAELARLARDPALVRGLAETVRREAPQRSMRSFARALSEALG